MPSWCPRQVIGRCRPTQRQPCRCQSAPYRRVAGFNKYTPYPRLFCGRQAPQSTNKLGPWHKDQPSPHRRTVGATHLVVSNARHERLLACIWKTGRQECSDNARTALDAPRRSMQRPEGRAPFPAAATVFIRRPRAGRERAGTRRAAAGLGAKLPLGWTAMAACPARRAHITGVWARTRVTMVPIVMHDESGRAQAGLQGKPGLMTTKIKQLAAPAITIARVSMQ